MVHPSRRSTGWLAVLLVLSGVMAALHVGKLPTVIPILSRELGMSLVQAGFLLSLIQVAGMALGAWAGSLADRLGPKRVLCAGLSLLAIGSLLSAWAQSVPGLMGARAVESAGFLFTVIAAPVLLRRWLTQPSALQKALGFWGAYMPIGIAIALLLTPWAYGAWGWRWTWVGLALMTLAVAVMVFLRVPTDTDHRSMGERRSMAAALAMTLTSSGPWLVALAFLMYSGQWMAVIGFLPTIYLESGWSPAWIGPLTAMAAGVNLIGNIMAGRLLAYGTSPGLLMGLGYLSMMAGAWGVLAAGWPPVMQYGAVLMFSALGGMIPATLFSMALALAPSRETVTTTVGWVQQLSSTGQFMTPPLVAWIAAGFGGWQHTVWMNMVLGGCGVFLAWRLQSRWRMFKRPAHG